MNCQQCEKKMIGRADKKFCSLKCKNDFHKALRLTNKSIVDKVDKILHRNYAVLIELTQNTKTMKVMIPRIQLAKAGFNFNYYTGTYKNIQNKIYHYIYDFAWMEFSSQEVLIIKEKKKFK